MRMPRVLTCAEGNTEASATSGFMLLIVKSHEKPIIKRQIAQTAGFVGPSAIVALPSGDFLVTCYDSGSIARISAGGKTETEYKQDREGRSFQCPNDLVVDQKGEPTPLKNIWDQA